MFHPAQPIIYGDGMLGHTQWGVDGWVISTGSFASFAPPQALFVALTSFS